MRVGDLVRTTRASIGIPKNTIGLIMKHTWIEPSVGDIDYDESFEGYDIWHVLVHARTRNRIMRRITRDLEVIKNESR